MKFGARLDGTKRFRTLVENIAELPSDDVLTRALRAGAQPIAERARSLVRRRTGRLHDSITVSTELSPHQAQISPKEGRIEVYVGPGALAEAITEEFGTAHEAAHPYMRPAWDSEQRTALDTVTDVIADEFDKRAGH